MKKILFLLLIALSIVSCKENNLPEEPIEQPTEQQTEQPEVVVPQNILSAEAIHFIGVDSVELVDYEEDYFIKDNFKISIAPSLTTGSKFDLYLSQAQFAEKMPPMDILIPNIDFANNQLSGNDIVPLANLPLGMLPVELYTIQNLQGSITLSADGTSTIRFTMNCGIYPTVYNGKQTTWE